MDKDLDKEVQQFKQTMGKCGLSWNPSDIDSAKAEPLHYNEMPPDQKEFVMLRAAERWTAYHQTLCEHGEKEFADKYFSLKGPGASDLGPVLKEIRYQNDLDKDPGKAATSNWWDRTKSAVRNIFDLENLEER